MNEDVEREIYAEQEGALLRLTIRREAKRNALSAAHFERLAILIKEAASLPHVRVVVLTGAGEKAFCAGADLSVEGAAVRLADQRTTGLGNVLRAAAALPKPIVARVNGDCHGGGVGLLGACDLAVAAEDVRFALPEVRLGLFPFVVMAAHQRRANVRRLAALALTAAPVGAKEALDMGLVTHISPRLDLDEALAGIVDSLASSAPAAIATGLALLRGDRQSRLSDIAEGEARLRRLLSGRRQGGPVHFLGNSHEPD